MGERCTEEGEGGRKGGRGRTEEGEKRKGGKVVSPIITTTAKRLLPLHLPLLLPLPTFPSPALPRLLHPIPSLPPSPPAPHLRLLDHRSQLRRTAP